MNKILVCCLLFSAFFRGNTLAQEKEKNGLPIKAFCISAPSRAQLDSFLLFVEKDLGPAGVNTLVLRVDYNFQYKSNTKLAEPGGLSEADVKRMVSICKKQGIAIVPQINLLGHQSWASYTGKLLQVYPELDETPWVKLPAEYKWPNADGLYCKSYCPLHPKVHSIVFPLVDEICDAFEAKSFHAGMDEVFYIGEEKCTRCSGKSKAGLFAGEVKKIRDHLAEKGRTLWIWGDRLIDGNTTGMGMWEASTNNTFPAIDLIPKDVVICDWHYDRADKTPVYFAVKGFQVISCGWNTPKVSKTQAEDMFRFRETAPRLMKSKYLGVMQTIWTSVPEFIRGYYGNETGEKTQAGAFRAMVAEMNRLP